MYFNDPIYKILKLRYLFIKLIILIRRFYLFYLLKTIIVKLKRFESIQIV
jgi:hypothetical protein